ncbi:efflux RND transporter permease subunit [Leptospira alexanderi]|uniref:efflux RND transporter permease subunit n=1 Tax=Leptospira alexanderi TaxID=100053 RepID=UPI000990DF61|nr:efflux RND transporter permease subunit [Leptospira alexanderi]
MNRKENRFINFGPVTLGMIFLGFVIFGLLSYIRNPVTLFSTVQYPALTISVEYPGADVEDVEQTITVPIEETISNIGGIEVIHSFAERGKTDINVEFQKNVNLQFKSLEIRERIDILSGQFPKEVHKPFLYQYDPDERPVLIITLKSTKYDLIELRRIADFEVKRYLENLEGVSRIAVSGGKIREILVSCDMQKLTGFGLDLLEVQRAIQNHNKPVSIGKIENVGREFKVISSGRLKSINEIQKIPIFLKERNKTIYIEDIADVSFSYRDEESASRVNGNENISIYIYKSSLGNILELSKETRNKLRQLNIADVEFEMIYDQTESIVKTYWNLCITLALGLLLFALTIQKTKSFHYFKIKTIFFLQLVIVFFTIQLILFILKIPFDVVVFSGIVIGFSFWLIIVVHLGEYINAKKEKLTLKSFRAEFITLLAILIAITIPPYVLDKNTGLPSLKLGLTIVTYLTLSYITFTPLIFFLDNSIAYRVKNFTTLPIGHENKFDTIRNMIQKNRFIDSIRTHLAKLQTKLEILKKYKNFILAAKYTCYLIIILFVIVRFYNIPKELFYSSESQKLLAYIELPSGTGFEFTNSTAKKIENKILAVQGVKEVTSKIEPAHSFLLITLNDDEIGNDEFIEKIREGIGNTNPAFCYISKESDAAQFKEITVDILGDQNEELSKVINNITPRVSKIKGVQEIVLRYKSPREELQVLLDKNKTIESSLSNDEIGNFLKIAIQGGVVTKFLDDNREMDVRVRFSREYRNSQDSLNLFYLKNNTGKYIPLTEIAFTKESKSPIKTYRKNKKRMLSFSLRSSKVSHSEILTELKNIGSEELPANYQLEIGRNVEKILESENQIYAVLIGSLLFIFMILSSYFESFTKPFAVIISFFVPIFLTFFLLSFIFNALTLPIYLGLLLLTSLVSFQIIQKIKFSEVKRTENRWRDLLLLGSLFMPQIFYPVEGGHFLQQLEITLILGYTLSHLFTLRILNYIQDGKFSEEIKFLKNISLNGIRSVWKLIYHRNLRFSRR